MGDGSILNIDNISVENSTMIKAQCYSIYGLNMKDNKLNINNMI